MLVLLTGSLNIAISAGLIAFNKSLMAPGRFPFPAALGLLHSIFCSLMAALLYLMKPGLFTSLTDPEKKISVQDRTLWKAILPIAVLFVAQIILSNQAYRFADIAFLQMMKESNVVTVYILSIVFALEVFKRRQMALILLIAFSTGMSVTGDLTFTWVAFLLQGACCFSESSRITLQSLLLSSAGKGLDAFSYMLLVMPISAGIFGGMLLFLSFAIPNQQFLLMPAVSDWMKMKWVLLVNACVALALNISALVFIKCSSAVAFVLAGIIKDICIVLVGIYFMGHPTTVLQVCGFTLQVSLILIYSLTKTFPKEFESGIIDGLQIVVMGKSLEPKMTVKEGKAPGDYGAAKERDPRLAELKDSKV